MVVSRVKRNSNSNYQKVKKLQTNKYVTFEGNDKSICRAPYFKSRRPERIIMKQLENTTTVTYSNKCYRANRYLYYIVIPFLCKYLYWKPDRVRLKEISKSLYQSMLSYRFTKNHDLNLEISRLNTWIFQTKPTTDCSLAKL